MPNINDIRFTKWDGTKYIEEFAPMPSGGPASNLVLQVVQAVDSTYSSTTSVIGFDDTLPLISEGLQILSQVLSTSSATNKILVEVSLPFVASSGANAWVAAAVFRDSVCIASTVFITAGANFGGPVSLSILDSPGATSATYSVRYGPGATGATAYNNGTAGQRFLGGASISTLTLSEIQA